MRNATDTREKKGNLRRINHAFRLLSSLREAVEAVLVEGEESDGGCERAEKVLSRLRAIAIGKDVDFSFDDAAEVSPIQKRKGHICTKTIFSFQDILAVFDASDLATPESPLDGEAAAEIFKCIVDTFRPSIPEFLVT